ncbi:uncharacterized protein K460DRAFT_147027 [Cucurbitaria berberidis CBS 394.84]|uniref:Uncharacterized protein n=1 Tax=Cucurbitaria berberidis CBS 394.84 TaxID=1168544 RepID=A0A9P4L688_9PLEO|nr:uncharacterized protein K460DRAFT_147027 [Cucurbitaria berberidis CBS 394.84]KAF1843545.1 hypothetical protein K460DRAFT_147027 [Cucurbitaria berberidis CBS 394.84]
MRPDQIDPLAWNFSHDARAFDRSNLPNTSHVYPLRLRNQVSINVTEKSLRMDFNLVPCIPDPQKNPKDKKHLRAILGDVFGQALHDGNVSQYLPMLQDFFLGMEVKRNYRPDEPFKLVDVAMPQNFKPSVIKGVAGNSTSYTVVDYFNQVILEDGKKIEYPHFPLVRGGLDSWFPMEMLQPVKEQPLHRFEPLLPTLKKHVVQFSKLDRAGEAVAKKQADDFFDEFTKVRGNDIAFWGGWKMLIGLGCCYEASLF